MRLLALGVVVGALLSGSPALGAGKARSKPAKLAAPSAQSIGAPNGGRLVGGVKVKRSATITVREGSATWALPELRDLLTRASREVARKVRGSALLVGDLSGPKGGVIAGHHSHQSGRDVDVGFYVTNSKGHPLPTKAFVAFDKDGAPRTGKKFPRFDDARNWAFVEALLTDRKANVRYVFVSNPLRARLLEYAKTKRKAPKALIERAAAAMMRPANVEEHDDHFHVRIACPESMRGVCVEESRVSKPAAQSDDVYAEGAAHSAPAAAPPSGE